jgi:hypothetical protein
MGSSIANYDYTTTYACKTGYTWKQNPFFAIKISCACSFAAQYYQNGPNCIACASSLPSGISLASCVACDPTANFYKGSVQCIYCPGVFLALGTATVNGCDCPNNYFWNADTDQCECDFVLGFIGGATANCIDCSTIANTGQKALQNACSCLPGYKWDSVSNTCICDISTNSIYFSGGACVDCAVMPGASGNVGSDSASCECIAGYYWNPGHQACLCDFTQNYVVINGFCTGCISVAQSTGLANAFGCICSNGFVYSSSGECLCPAGSVIIGSTCTSCSSAALPTGAVPADCSACTNAKGFSSQPLGCYACASQAGANTAVTNQQCTCSAIGMVWKPNLFACVCDWSQYYYTVINPSGTGFTCKQCPYITSNVANCVCGSPYSFYIIDIGNNICTKANYDPNGSGYAISFSCNNGYRWS